MAKGKVQGITYIWDRVIVGFLHTSFNGFFITVLVAGGVGVQDEGAGSSGTAMSVTPIAGGGAVSVEGVSCPDIVPATAIVTSSATEGDGSALSPSMGSASGAPFLLGGTSATFWRWEPGKEDEGLQDRVVISVQQNNSTVFIVRQTLTRQGQWRWLCVSSYPDVAGEREVRRPTSPRMIRRSRRLAPSPQPPGCPWLIRCQQFVLSVLWRHWAAYGKAGADRGVAGNSDTMLMNPVLRQIDNQLVSTLQIKGRSREVEHLLLVVDSGL
jgi:hypothetical protein